VWIASFPSGEVRRQVSTRGGESPQWGLNGREIFYVSREKELMSVSFRAEGGNVVIGAPRPLFHVPNLAEFDRLVFRTSSPFVSAPDGRRFLIAVQARDPDAPPIRVVANWPALLRR